MGAHLWQCCHLISPALAVAISVHRVALIRGQSSDVFNDFLLAVGVTACQIAKRKKYTEDIFYRQVQNYLESNILF